MSLTGKHRLRSFPLFHPFPPSSLFFSLPVPLPSRLPSILHRTRKGQLILSSGALAQTPSFAQRPREEREHSLPPYRPLSLSPLRWSCARVLCLGEVSASQSQVHFSLKCDVYLPGPVGRTARVSVAFVRSDCDPQIAPGL